MDASLAPPLMIPSRNGQPLLLSIPHSGRDYPAWLLAEARHGRRALASLEDPLVDRLAWRAIAAGFGAVVAKTPRGAIDCNRAPDELDPSAVAGTSVDMPLGPRARHGLGIIASRTQRHGTLWKRPLAHDRFVERLAAVHTPYHTGVAAALAALKATHDVVLLLDLHSMPPRGRGMPPLVIGDRHGSSAGSWLSAQAVAIAEQAGFRAVLNDPYAGGHIVERHGRPSEGVHALQIELDRSAYLANDLMSPGTGFDRCSKLLAALASGLAESISTHPQAMAAE